MKINGIKVLPILAITLLPVLSSLGQIILVDPDFEDEMLDPWFAEGSGGNISINSDTNYVYTGAQSVEVCFPSADNTGLSQNIAVGPSDVLQTYTMSFWVLARGFSAPIGVRACLWEFDPSGIIFNNGAYNFIPAGTTNWVQVTATIQTTDANATVFRAVCQIAPQGSPKVSGCLYVDDATLTLVTVSAANDLTWGGGLSANAWDFMTANWLDTATSAPKLYTDTSVVRFTDAGNDTAPVLLNRTVSPAAIDISSSIDYAVTGSGKISGGAMLKLSGSGIFTLAVTNNDYTNNTIIGSGTLQLGGNEVVPSGSGKGSVTLGGTLDLNGYNQTVNNLTGSGALVNSSTNSSSLTLDIVNDSTFNGSVTSPGGGLLNQVKAGPGMLIKGGGPDSFSGQTIINGGRILLQDGSFFGSGSVTISNRAYLMLWGTIGSGVIANDFYLYSVAGIQGGEVKDAVFMDSGSGAMTLSGTVHLRGSADVGAYNGETLTLSGKITGPGGLWKGSPAVLVTQGTNGLAGEVILSNSANDFSGGLAVYGGILEIQADGAGGSGDVLVSTNATLQLDTTAGLNSGCKLSLSDASSLVNLAYVGTQNIKSLSFDGGTTLQVAGTWGAPGSAALNQDARFTGSGVLNVVTSSLPVTPPIIGPVMYDWTGNNLLVCVSSVPGHQYTLMAATSLIPPVTWTPVSTNGGTGGTLTNLVPVQKKLPELFYRYQIK